MKADIYRYALCMMFRWMVMDDYRTMDSSHSLPLLFPRSF